jgi:hypothetical protein
VYLTVSKLHRQHDPQAFSPASELRTVSGRWPPTMLPWSLCTSERFAWFIPRYTKGSACLPLKRCIMDARLSQQKEKLYRSFVEERQSLSTPTSGRS